MNVVFGTVKFVNAVRGFGFVRLDGGAGDVHFWLDRGFTSAVGWRADSMGAMRKGENLGRLEIVRPATPKPGDRVALEYYLPDPTQNRRGRTQAKAKGPTAEWWAFEVPWKAVQDVIEARKEQYPVGLYYWPIEYGDGRALHVSYRCPGEHETYTSHYDYGRVPAHWAVVERAGELPHESFARGMVPADWDTYLSPGLLERFSIVRGRAEYVAALRSELTDLEDRVVVAERASGPKRPKPKLRLDGVGNGEIHYMGVSLQVTGFRITTGKKEGFSWPGDPDDPEYTEVTYSTELGGHEVSALPGPVLVLARAAEKKEDVRDSWDILISELSRGVQHDLSWMRKRVVAIHAEIERQEASE